MADELTFSFGRVLPSMRSPVLYSAVVRGCLFSLALTFCTSVTAHTTEPHQSTSSDFDPDEALKQSQAAIGRKLRDYHFIDESGQSVKLSDYRGMPVVISMIYSSCFHTCPVTTQHLKEAIRSVRKSLAGKPIQVLSIGFDTPTDNPQSMLGFRRTQAVDADRWAFLSSDPKTLKDLTKDLGFAYYASPRGYDHLVQLSVLDDSGVLYQQVYGERFDLPWLAEPLKEIVYKDKRGIGQTLSNIGNRIRLFCTIYDPGSGRYRFDYSLFIQMFIGAMVIISGFVYLFREVRRGRNIKASVSI